MKVDLIDILLFVLIVQMISFAMFLFFSNSRRMIQPGKILAFFLIAKSLCVSNFLSFRQSSYFYEHFPHLFYFGSSFTILFGPLLYFYVKSLLYRDFKFKPVYWLHLFPFLIHFSYLLFKFHVFDADTKRELLSAGTAVIFSPSVSLGLSIALYLYILIYTLTSIRLLYQYKRRLEDHYANLEQVYFNWISLVLYGFLMKWLADIWYLYEVYVNGDYQGPGLIVSRLILFLLINIMIFKALRQPELFRGIEEKVNEKKHSLSQVIFDIYREKLNQYMSEKKPFLTPAITLETLAKRVDIPPRSLTEVIQRSYQQNFYDFINEFRIRESEKMLSHASSHQKSILDVMVEVGFNSKSSFYAAFKKFAGMTPAQYKKNDSML